MNSSSSNVRPKENKDHKIGQVDKSVRTSLTHQSSEIKKRILDEWTGDEEQSGDEPRNIRNSDLLPRESFIPNKKTRREKKSKKRSLNHKTAMIVNDYALSGNSDNEEIFLEEDKDERNTINEFENAKDEQKSISTSERHEPETNNTNGVIELIPKAREDFSDGQSMDVTCDNEENLIKIRVANRHLQHKTIGIERDVKTINKRLNGFSKELKEMKKLINQQTEIQPSLTSSLDEEDNFPLIPTFPRTKKKHISMMEANIITDAEFKRQLITKLKVYGGSNTKQKIINIFNHLFTPKLKHKFSWKGTLGPHGKLAFENYEGILDSIRQAVGTNLTTVIDECKLRFKQANKDYERARLKENVERYQN